MSRTRLTIDLAAVLLVAAAVLTPFSAHATQPELPSAMGVAVPPSAPLAEPELSMPVGDFSEDGVEPVGLGRGREYRPSAPEVEAFEPASLGEPDSRTEFTNTYELGGGRTVTQIGSAPLNARVDGTWTDVSTSLHPGPGAGWKAEAHPLRPGFAAWADEENAFRVSRDGYDIGFTLQGAGPVRGVVLSSGEAGELRDELVYPGAVDGGDLTYNVDDGLVKETIVLREPPAPGANVWRWTVDAPGLTLTRGEAGAIDFRDADGNLVVVMPPMAMWDASGPENAQPLATSFSRRGDAWRITVIASDEWLEDPARVYPVSVDPSVWATYPSTFLAMKSNGPTSTAYVQVGKTSESGGPYYWRTAVAFPYWTVWSKQYVAAAISVAYRTGSTTSYTGGLYSASCWTGYSCLGSNLTPLTFAGSGTSWATDVNNYGLANRIAMWARAGSTGGAFMMTGNEANNPSYKGVNTALYVWSQDFPSTPTVDTAVSPTGGVRKGAVFKVNSATTPESGLEYQYRVSTSAATLDSGATYTSTWSTSQLHQTQSGVLTPGTLYYWKGCVRAGGGMDGWLGTSTVRCSAVNSFIANSPAATPPQAGSTPADGEILTTLTPTFTAPTVTDAEGDPVRYRFRLATGADGATGSLITSEWLTTPTWTVPAGTLLDGGSYHWSVITDDGFDKNAAAWVNSVKIDLRMGASGPSPMDAAGPVTVNLASGNANLTFASPTVSTLGGPMGMAFSYNSLQAVQDFHGLRGSYYDAITPPATTPSFAIAAGQEPLLVRTDPRIEFDWVAGSPGPSVPTDDFLVRWSGYIRTPATGNYIFGVTRDNGAKLTIGGSSILSVWGQGTTWIKQWGTSKSMAAGTAYAIQLDYYEDIGNAKLELWVRPPGGRSTGEDDFIVPSDWLTPG